MHSPEISARGLTRLLTLAIHLKLSLHRRLRTVVEHEIVRRQDHWLFLSSAMRKAIGSAGFAFVSALTAAFSFAVTPWAFR